MAASSSSAWMKAKFFRPVSGSTRIRSAKALYASISEVDGVIGYQAPTVAPANTQPSAAEVLPSIMMWPRVFEPPSRSDGATCSGSGHVKCSRA